VNGAAQTADDSRSELCGASPRPSGGGGASAARYPEQNENHGDSQSLEGFGRGGG